MKKYYFCNVIYLVFVVMFSADVFVAMRFFEITIKP